MYIPNIDINAFTEVYEYANDGTATHKTNIDDLTGRINWNSNPVGGTRVPGANDVWAIRITVDGRNDKGKPKENRMGHATSGSPGRYSLVKIFPTNIENKIKTEWASFEGLDDLFTEEQKKIHIANAVKIIIRMTIAHEVVHSINIPAHCMHLHCLMLDATEMTFFGDGSYAIVKKKKNPAAETDRDADEWIFDRDKDGNVRTLSKPLLHDAHLDDLAVTGNPVSAPSGSSISECSCVEISFSGLKTLPEAPAIGSVILQGDTQIRVTWSAPASDGWDAISDYEYRYQASDATESGAWTSGGMDFSETITGLTAGESYTIEVRAKNSVGYSVASASYSFTMPVSMTVPSAPRALSAVGGNGSVELSWQPPLSDGNSAITHYQYRYGIGESVTVENYTDWVSMGSAMATYPVSPLTNDMYHIFEVRAVNAIGNSAPSASASATPTAPIITTPGQPTGLSSTVSSGTVTLSWNAPTNTGGGIDGYEYRTDPNNDGSWGEWTSVEDGATSVTLMLENGRNYGFQVRAKNSAGTSTQSTKATATPIDPSVSVPSAPRNLSATAENGQVSLSWQAPATGTPVIEYEYKFDTYDNGTWQTWKITGSTSTSYTVTGLTNETLYAFLVRARNAGGAGTQSTKVTATPTAITVPTKPRNLTAAMTTNGYIRLDWSVPADNGGSSITDYEYCIDTYDDGSWGSWGTTGDTSTDEYFTEYSDATTYAFKIRAVNSAGAGPASDKAVITTPTTITSPSAPQNFSADPGNASVSLSWSAPSDDGGGTITYQYRYGISGSTYNGWSSEQSSTSVNISGLTNGTTYQFELIAKNSAGNSPTVTDTATPTDKTVPGVPTYFDTDDENGAVELLWEPPVNDGGSAVTNYQYRYRESGGTWNSWTSTGISDPEFPDYTVTGLTNGTAYDFQLRAQNEIGYGSPTSTLTETPQATKPDSPTSVSASTGSATGSVDLSWSAPTDDGGSPITDYTYAYGKWENGRWQWRVPYTSIGSTSTSYTVTGLDSGGTYRFRVRAVNSVGTSSTSRVAQANAP